MYRRSQRWMLIINNRFLSVYDYNFLLEIEMIFSWKSAHYWYLFPFGVSISCWIRYKMCLVNVVSAITRKKTFNPAGSSLRQQSKQDLYDRTLTVGSHFVCVLIGLYNPLREKRACYDWFLFQESYANTFVDFLLALCWHIFIESHIP